MHQPGWCHHQLSGPLLSLVLSARPHHILTIHATLLQVPKCCMERVICSAECAPAVCTDHNNSELGGNQEGTTSTLTSAAPRTYYVCASAIFQHCCAALSAALSDMSDLSCPDGPDSCHVTSSSTSSIPPLFDRKMFAMCSMASQTPGCSSVSYLHATDHRSACQHNLLCLRIAASQHDLIIYMYMYKLCILKYVKISQCISGALPCAESDRGVYAPQAFAASLCLSLQSDQRLKHNCTGIAAICTLILS